MNENELLQDGLVIQVDFFNNRGKWKYGGEVNIGDARLWDRERFKQAIVDNQNIIHDGWQGHYQVVTDEVPRLYDNPDYREFSKALFHIDAFTGYKRSGAK